MYNFSKKCLWSELKITIFDKFVDKNIIEKCFFEVETFENKYSRFKKDNFLYKLNKDKFAYADNDLLSMIKLSKKISEISYWYFDITVLPFLENIWYGIENKKLKENYWYKNIKITEDKQIILENNVSIELWAVWKWYMVDTIYNILDKNYKSFLINFWWDIKVKWNHKIYLEDPLKLWKSLGYIELENSSIASSSWNRRQIKDWNHLINPKKDLEQDKIAVYTTHKLSSFSDILSTAIFVTPLEKAIDIIEKTNWLQALMIMKDGSIYKSKWFNFKK